MAHKTGVAAGALVIFLRMLCEPTADAIFNHTLQVKINPENIPRGPQVSRNLTYTAINKSKGKPISNVRHGLNDNSQHQNVVQHQNIVDPNEIKPVRQAAKVNVNSNKKKLNHPADTLHAMNNQPNTIVHNRVLSHNDPAVLNNLRGNVKDNKEIKIFDSVKHFKNEMKVGGPPVQATKLNKSTENEEMKKSIVQSPVELTMPNDDGDNDDDGDYDDDDEYNYDDDDADDDGGNDDDDGYLDEEDEDGNNTDNKRVPLQKDPDYVDKEDDKDDEYDDENYDDGNDDDDDGDDGNYDDQGDNENNDGAAPADYDDKLKSANNEKLPKSKNNVGNKEILKGHINSRNIVNRNDFQVDNGDVDNKRYDGKVKPGKDAHDRYAYDDYRNGKDDDDDDDDGGDEYDYDDKDEHREIKDTNSDIKLESVIHSKDTQVGALQNSVNISRDHTVSSNSALFVFAFCFVSVVLLAYRFIKKRRIHFRFHPRISQRV